MYALPQISKVSHSFMTVYKKQLRVILIIFISLIPTRTFMYSNSNDNYRIILQPYQEDDGRRLVSESTNSHSQNNLDDDEIAFHFDERFGIDRPKAEIKESSIVGRVRTFKSITEIEWVFFALTLLTIFMEIIFSAFFLIKFETNKLQWAIATNNLLNYIFMVYYLFISIFKEKVYSLVILIIALLLIMIACVGNVVVVAMYHDGLEYSIADFDSLKGSVIAECVLTVILVPVITVLGIIIIRKYMTSANFVFRIVGADTRLQTICKKQFVAEGMLLFDLQCCLSVLLLLIWSEEVVIKDENKNYQTLPLALGFGFPFCMIWYLLCYLSLRLEDCKLLILAGIFGIVKPAFLCFFISLFFNNLKTIHHSYELYKLTILAIVMITAFIVLIDQILLTIYCIILARQFGSGLKDKLSLPPLVKKFLDSRNTSSSCKCKLSGKQVQETLT